MVVRPRSDRSAAATSRSAAVSSWPVAFVEHQERGLAEQRRRQHDPLALAPRQPRAAVGDHRLETVRQGGHEVGGGGQAHGAPRLLLRRPRIGPEQFGPDGLVEQVRVLEDARDRPPLAAPRTAGQRRAVYPDRAGAGLEEAEQQVGQGALPASDGPVTATSRPAGTTKSTSASAGRPPGRRRRTTPLTLPARGAGASARPPARLAARSSRSISAACSRPGSACAVCWAICCRRRRAGRTRTAMNARHQQFGRPQPGVAHRESDQRRNHGGGADVEDRPRRRARPDEGERAVTDGEMAKASAPCARANAAVTDAWIGCMAPCPARVDVVRQRVQQVGLPPADQERPRGLGGSRVHAFTQPVDEPVAHGRKVHLALPRHGGPQRHEQHEGTEQHGSHKVDAERRGGPGHGVADRARCAVCAAQPGEMQERG